MGWVTLLPPVIAIAVAVWKKDVIVALLAALLSVQLLLSGGNPAQGFLGLIDSIVSVFSNPDNTRIVLFSFLVGVLIKLMHKSGGVAALISLLSRRGVANSKRKVAFLPVILGTLVFIETNLSILTAGLVSQDLFDKLKLSRARLAYFIDSTCAPICTILLFNAWGAYLLALLSDFGCSSDPASSPDCVANPVESLVFSIPYNFYSWVTVLIVLYTAFSGRVFGYMQNSERLLDSTYVTQKKPELPTRARLTLVPLISMVAGIFFFMWYTGDGHILKGSGATSVLWSVSLACMLAGGMTLVYANGVNTSVLVKWGFAGMADLLPLVATLVLALALGASMKTLGTGDFVSRLIGDSLPLWSVPAVVFICASLVSFTTGTSWGTFSILTPIAVPIALASQIPVEIVMAGVIGGGVFGDHCSPISDTTIVSSMAAGCDHMEHVKTQLPYALTAGMLSTMGYLAIGISLYQT